MPAWLREQAKVGAWILGADLIAATGMAVLALLGLTVLGRDSSGGPGSSATPSFGASDLLALWAQSLGLPLFGGAGLTAGAGAGGALLYFTPAVATAGVGVVTYWASAQAAATSTRPALAARDAAVAAALPVLAVMVLTTLLPVTLGPMRVASDLATLLLGFVFLVVVGFVARARTTPSAWGSARAWAQSSQLRRAGAGLSAHGAAMAAMLLVFGLLSLLVTAGLLDTVGWVLLAPLLGGNVLVAASALAHGGTLSVVAGLGVFGSTQSVSVFSEGNSGWAWLLPVAAVLACLVAGLRMGLGMPDGWHRQWRDVWVVPAVFFVAWTLLFLAFGRASLSGQVSGIPLLGTAQADLSVAVVPAAGLLMALWGLVVEVSARLLAPAAQRRLPALPALLRVRAWAAPVAGASASGTPAASGAPAAPGAPAAAGTPAGSGPVPGGHVGQSPASAKGAGPASGSGLLATTPSLTPQQRARVTFWGIVVAGILAVGVVGVLSVRWLGSAFFGPSTMVEQYLASLHAGDAEAATALSDPGVPNAQRGGLSNAVLSGASARLDSVFLGETSVTGSTASIPVQYSVDGQRVTTTMTAERAGTTFLVFPAWRLTSSLAQPLSVTSTVGASINGADVAPADPPLSDDLATYLYPGTYSVTGAKAGNTVKWLTSSVATVSMTSPSRSASVSLSAQPTRALVDEVNVLAKRLVDSCVASGLDSPRSSLGDCPFSTYASDGKATWKVLSYPKLDVGVSSYSQSLSASTATAGSIQVTTSSSWFGPSTSTQSLRFSSSAVTIDKDGTVHLQT